MYSWHVRPALVMSCDVQTTGRVLRPAYVFCTQLLLPVYIHVTSWSTASIGIIVVLISCQDHSRIRMRLESKVTCDIVSLDHTSQFSFRPHDAPELLCSCGPDPPAFLCLLADPANQIMQRPFSVLGKHRKTI